MEANVELQNETIDTKAKQFIDHVADKQFPCIAARSALNHNQIKFINATHIGCPHDDLRILNELYQFTDNYRLNDQNFHSAVVLFDQPLELSEEQFDRFMWRRLQALHELDKQNYPYDHRVDPDPSSKDFSFSLKEEAYFIIGMHPGSARPARRFKTPALVFNPHAQFEKLRTEHRYEKIQQVIRKRDLSFSGSLNPMLSDFGDSSEVLQYSGINYPRDWKCPLNISAKTS
ncbi:MAG: YqcI/YcgG family protein [Chitinophagaceae bacterium]|nr:MAG: YqcI/YcgG family protein [Chitinophagaceae bacterium]